MQFSFDAQELFGLAFFQGGNRNARPSSNYLFDVRTIDLRHHERIVFLGNRSLRPPISRAFPFS